MLGSTLKKEPRFVVIEGPDGVGKTSTALHLISLLKGVGYNPIYLREPGSDSVSEAIRSLALSSALHSKMEANTKMLLMFASRYQLSVAIKEHLKQEKAVVICDRYTLSTLVYQVLLEGASYRTWESLTRTLPIPDVLVGLTAPFFTCLDRQRADGRDVNCYDNETTEHKRNVHRKYNFVLNPLATTSSTILDIDVDDLDISLLYKDRFIYLPSEGTTEELAQKLFIKLF